MQLRMKILNLNGPDDGLLINENWIRKNFNKVDKNDDETIATLTEYQGLKARLKNNKPF